MEKISLPILKSNNLKYLTKVFELALHQVESRLKEDKGFLHVEYELYPFDSGRVVITASNRKIEESDEEETHTPGRQELILYLLKTLR
ncbi:hypothetical protein IC006_0683 [Sulfuracidifex tepidarius]|uniref:Uncharacterized protein n=2 Tax=Sulfuracidifex tepidarius TaxID=1294262 RepID=A0A510DTA1_9CREN|nr:hypothetical protein IC006_0683 [Sulfuracidifex tepidarius]